MGQFISEPTTLNDGASRLLKAAQADAQTFVDIVEMADLNNPLLDCTFHADYCLHKFNISYGACLIACQPPLAYISYKTKGGCV